MLQLLSEGTLRHQVSPKAKKLVLVLVTFTPVTETRGEAVKIAETAKEGRNSEESEGEYPNLARVLYIQCPITFHKKSVLILALFD